MSTRDERRDWQDFREKHGSTKLQFRKKWQAMFGRYPTPVEEAEFVEKRRQLIKPLGREAQKAKDDLLASGIPPGASPHDLNVPASGYAAEPPAGHEPDVTVTRRYEWDMGHRLPNHQGKCRRLHGHRYVLEVDITGQVADRGDSAGMVIDFGTLDRLIREKIEFWDHRTMLYNDDPIYPPRQENEAWGIFRVLFMPTAENIALEVLSRLRKSDFENPFAWVSRVRIYETPNAWAEVRP